MLVPRIVMGVSLGLALGVLCVASLLDDAAPNGWAQGPTPDHTAERETATAIAATVVAISPTLTSAAGATMLARLTPATGTYTPPAPEPTAAAYPAPPSPTAEPFAWRTRRVLIPLATRGR